MIPVNQGRQAPAGWLVFGVGSERLSPAYVEIRANDRALGLGPTRDAVVFCRGGLWFVAIRPNHLRHPPVELQVFERRKRRCAFWPPRLFGPPAEREPALVWRFIYDPLVTPIRRRRPPAG